MTIKGLAPTLLLAAFCALAVSSMYGESTTGDEVAHLPSGYTYLKTGDFRLNVQHPPLIKALAGAPLLLLDLKPITASPGWEKGDEWAFGKDFLLNNRQPHWLLVFLGRLPMVAVGALMGALLFLWGRELWGYWPAVFVLFLYVFEPNILAHTRLVTTDVGVSCFTVLTLYALWKFSRSGKISHVVWCGVALGLALLSKYSGLVTAMVVAGMLATLLCLGKPDHIGSGVRPNGNGFPSFGRRLRALAGCGLLIALLAVLLITVGFGFPTGIANYHHGFTKIYADFNPKWQAFLWGEYSKDGFWYYYLLAHLWKTPLPALVFFIAALFLIDVSDRPALLDWIFVLAPIAAFHAAGSFNHANIGVRHVLPAFPFVLLTAGATARWVATQRVAYKVVFALLCVWYVTGTLRVYPHFIPYFNELAGGPENGISYLDDSNVEWGQDFYGVKRYLDSNKPSDVRLVAFSPVRPERYGIEYNAMRLRDVVWPQEGTTYVVGASFLQRNSLSNKYPGVRFHWRERYRPVHKIGWSIYVYRFSTIPTEQHAPEVFYIPKDKWYDDAINTLLPIVAGSSEFTEARQLLAEVYAARGRWRAQRGNLEAAVIDDLNAVETAPQTAYRLQFRDDVSRLPAVLAVEETVPAAMYFSEAAVHFRSNHQAQALLALLRCLKRDPNHIEAHLNLGTVMAQLGFPGLARREWEQCLSLDPNYTPAQQNLARLASASPRIPGRDGTGNATEGHAP